MGIDVIMFVQADHTLTDEEQADIATRLDEHAPDFLWTRDGERPIRPVGEYAATYILEDATNWYEVLSYHRYYSPSYRRGPIELIARAADWLEANVGPVLYGRDVDGAVSPWSEFRKTL